jgi:hypothetical protein
MISRERAAVEPISEVVKLSDALIGAIRIRVNESVCKAVDAERGRDVARRMVRLAMETAGIPFAKGAGDLSFDVCGGALFSYRLAEDLTEYVWLPDISDRKKLMHTAGFDWQIYTPERLA